MSTETKKQDLTGHPVSYTAKELSELGRDQLPSELISNRHLIYSSPAALAFNSPGAEGFGVKRAALSIPGSVMLLVAPGCCGRNTSLVSNLPGYENRFFYLQMKETDVITGRHLKKIPAKVEEIYRSLDPKPEVIMICITCVDALLGTDMERVCRKAEERIGIPVRPSYMYALTREGRKPPMVHVRQSLYSLLEPARKRANVANILGFFAPLKDNCELYELLHQAGIRTIHEISRCRNLAEFRTMSEANFNLVLNPEARFAARDFEERLQIPSVELRRVYQPDKIYGQYQALAGVLGVSLPAESYYEAIRKQVKAFREKFRGLQLSIGECMNGDPFEMALAFTRMGFRVDEIFGTVTSENFIYIRHLAELSPDTRIYSNLEPTMIFYGNQRKEEKRIEPVTESGISVQIEDSDAAVCRITIGKDAGYYHPELPNVSWNSDTQPFGFAGLSELLSELEAALEDRVQAKKRPNAGKIFSTTAPELTPFAPDQSGAVSVLFELGGIQVVCDAGGCVGNICGFDEPRWFEQRSAIFSAGLRDMDAIMGRDKQLVEKLVDALTRTQAGFAAIIGTPVPSVIGTDYHALTRMAERKTKLPILAIDTNGMELYDVGEEKAYLELLRVFVKEAEKNRSTERTAKSESEQVSIQTAEQVTKQPDKQSQVKKLNRLGVFGMTPLDFSDLRAAEKLRKNLRKREAELQENCGATLFEDFEIGEDTEISVYGMGAGLDEIGQAHRVRRNLVVSPAGLAPAQYLERNYHIPYEVMDPLAADHLPAEADFAKKRVLVIAQQVTANTLREELLIREAGAVQNATWFLKKKELEQPGDLHLKQEADFIRLVSEWKPDVILADAILKPLIPDYTGEWIDLIHFALSGRMYR